MRLEEMKEATLAKVIEVTLEEYAKDCETSPHRDYYSPGSHYHPDKCGYIGQILDKVEKQRSEAER